MKPAPRRIGELLETANHSAIARKLGVDQTTVSRWASGKAIPSGDKLQALARILRCSADEIDLSRETAA
jgi:transcriptional regulator with XRE-family HTH domain